MAAVREDPGVRDLLLAGWQREQPAARVLEPGLPAGITPPHRGILLGTAASTPSASTNSSDIENTCSSMTSSTLDAITCRAESTAAPLSTPANTSTARTTSRSCCLPQLPTARPSLPDAASVRTGAMIPATSSERG
ncbi:hypothetical protein [Streptomyces sp. A1-5]|uniref:hypothetical protein n=1 Tax=Streptomyces sp. A1-5 TaxID=2738410 RepID=UPI001F405450|nr:hypothetical protein [Streptomyces sp. A1-5]UJB46269.1 hypothetical protein HRD51_41080 [Streptomyces sp. A1-5]